MNIVRGLEGSLVRVRGKAWSEVAPLYNGSIPLLLTYSLYQTENMEKLMNLTSCENCGVVLNKNDLVFPSVYYDNDTEIIDTEHAEWDGEDYVAILPCPVCGSNIRGPK